MPSAVADVVLETRDVTKIFGGLRAVAGVSLQARTGETLGICGPNGAGKTTLFDAITGHVTATSGEILLGDQPLGGANIHQRCRLGIARTFQHPVAADSLTVLENALVAVTYRRGRTGRRWSRSADLAGATAALDAVGLCDSSSTPAAQLPVYDKKRLMIATALATNPRVLLLDEPFGGLNPNEIDEMLLLIRGVCLTGIAVVCIEHVMRALVALADRILVMHHGAQLFVGTPKAMLADEQVRDVYLGSTKDGVL